MKIHENPLSQASLEKENEARSKTNKTVTASAIKTTPKEKPSASQKKKTKSWVINKG